MEPKRVEGTDPNKIIRYKSKRTKTKPSSDVKKPQSPAQNGESQQSGCFRITKPTNTTDLGNENNTGAESTGCAFSIRKLSETSADNDTGAEQAGYTFEINKPTVLAEESPEIDPDHRYAVC